MQLHIWHLKLQYDASIIFVCCVLMHVGQDTVANIREARKANSLLQAITDGDHIALDTALASVSVSEVNMRASTGETPLLYAILTASVHACQLLVSHGADVNMEAAYYEMEPDVSDMCVCRWVSAVHAAIDCGNCDIVECVLEQVSGVVSVDVHKWERLCESAIKQHAVRLAELLVDKCKLSAQCGRYVLDRSKTYHRHADCSNCGG
jgi:hypothetical protein